MKGYKMFIYPPTTNVRTFAIEIFNTQRMDALKDSLVKKLFGQSNQLLSFPDKERVNFSNRKFLGVTEIPIEKILGTISRTNDFDKKFRPLKNNLRDRWTYVYANIDSEDCHPIKVHKIGDIFYVEDGHHRTSVARSMGKAFICAEVWEYSSNPSQYNPSRQQVSSVRPHSADTCPIKLKESDQVKI
jgi:hypothetical protein